MTWQEEAERRAGELGLRISSGYRTPEHNRAIGGAPGSHHTEGTPAAPGAIDVTGPAGTLRDFFNELAERFKGRIRELYLNIPGGQSQAIKGNQPLGSNPEAGRPQHLHISVGAPAEGIPAENRGEKAILAVGECSSRWCIGTLAGAIEKAKRSIPGASPDETVKTENCLCHSDLWFYGAGLVAVGFGLFMVFGSRSDNA